MTTLHHTYAAHVMVDKTWAMPSNLTLAFGCTSPHPLRYNFALVSDSPLRGPGYPGYPLRITEISHAGIADRDWG